MKTYNIKWIEEITYSCDVEAETEEEANNKFMEDSINESIEDSTFIEDSLIITELK